MTSSAAARAGGPVGGRPRKPLKARERELLRWVATGVTASGIAERLQINEWTAKSRIKAVMGKLGAHNRAELVARWLLLQADPEDRAWLLEFLAATAPREPVSMMRAGSVPLDSPARRLPGEGGAR